MNRPARAFTIYYAVLAKADNAAMVPLEAGWSDIGSWSALWKIGAQPACFRRNLSFCLPFS